MQFLPVNSCLTAETSYVINKATRQVQIIPKRSINGYNESVHVINIVQNNKLLKIA